MLDFSELRAQLKNLIATSEQERVEVPASLLAIPPSIEDFHKQIATLDVNFPLVDPVLIGESLKTWPKNWLIVGVDGSRYIATPPTFRSSFIILNTAVIAYSPHTLQYDWRVYTKVYPVEGEKDTATIESEATQYMLADEAVAASEFLKDRKEQALVLMDGTTYGELEDNSFLKQKFGVIGDMKTHPAHGLYQAALQKIHAAGNILCAASSQSKTHYISPVVMYNACPYRENPDRPMNCKLCKERQEGYNYDCESYELTDATYFHNVISNTFDWSQQDRLFASAPIHLKNGRVCTYLIQPHNRWYVRLSIPPHLMADFDRYHQVIAGVGMEMVLGIGFPYVLHEAHRLATIDGQARLSIESEAMRLGLYRPSPKSLGKQIMKTIGD